MPQNRGQNCIVIRGCSPGYVDYKTGYPYIEILPFLIILSCWIFSAPTEEDLTKGPNVEAALSISPTQALSKPQTRKPTIGQRKPQSAKKGVSHFMLHKIGLPVYVQMSQLSWCA